jgi:outer membrane lipoprotein-sorting protein
MKKLFLMSLLLVGTLVNAQDENVTKAKTLLDELSKKIKGYTSMQIEFAMNLKMSDGTTEEEKGKGTVKGEKYFVEMAGKEIRCDGKKAWTYDKDANECAVTCLDDEESSKEEDLMNPSKMFTFWEDGLKYTYEKEATDGGVKVDEIKLVPKDAKKSKFHTIILKINKSTKMIHSVTVKGKNGDVMTYKISKFNSDVTTKDSDFKFDKSKYPGVTMIDC